MRIIITGACAVSARSVCRSLRKSDKFKDAEFIGWDMVNSLYGLYEGLFDKIYKVPPVSSPSYKSVIDRILDVEKPDAVIVVPEVEVLYWASNSFNVACLLPPRDFCRVAISKKLVFEALMPYNLVPKSYEVNKNTLLSSDFESPLGYPVWVRDSSAGTASGKGSFKANNIEELCSWVKINTGIEEFQLSQYLPGGNFGVFMLFCKGRLKKIAIAERQEYIMSKVAISGITGNTSKGRLINNGFIKETALKAIGIICEKTKTRMNGLVVCDLKADEFGKPYITEINIRHVAFSSSFANAGFNIAEYQLLCALGRESELTPEIEREYPINNQILRDVDGLPIYVSNIIDIHDGEYVSKDSLDLIRVK